MDVPQEQLRARILPADPVPRVDPRPENYAAANIGRPAANPHLWDAGTAGSAGIGDFIIGVTPIGGVTPGPDDPLNDFDTPMQIWDD